MESQGLVTGHGHRTASTDRPVDPCRALRDAVPLRISEKSYGRVKLIDFGFAHEGLWSPGRSSKRACSIIVYGGVCVLWCPSISPGPANCLGVSSVTTRILGSVVVGDLKETCIYMDL